MEHDGGHMIDYGPHCKTLTLIGAFENKFDAKIYNWGALEAICDKYFHCESGHTLYNKTWATDIESFEELESFINKYESYDCEKLEGFVFHDVNGFMFKYKTKYYRDWKQARKALELILQNKQVKAENYELKEFVTWALENKQLLIDKGCNTIIKARNLFNETKGV